MKKIILGGIATLLIIPALVSAATIEEIIAQIQEKILNIQMQMQSLSNQTPPTTTTQTQTSTSVPTPSVSISSPTLLPVEIETSPQTISTIRAPLTPPLGSFKLGVSPVKIAGLRPVLEMTIPDINSRYNGGDSYFFGRIKSVDDSSHITMSVFLSSMMQFTADMSGAGSFSGRHDNTDQILIIPATVEIPPPGSVVVAFVAQSGSHFSVIRFEYIDGSYLMPIYGTIQNVDSANHTISVTVIDPRTLLFGETGGFAYARDFTKEINFLGRFPLLVGKTLTFYVPTYAKLTHEAVLVSVAPLYFQNIVTGKPVIVDGFRVFGDTLVVKKMHVGIGR